MGSDSIPDIAASSENVSSGEVEGESNNIDSLEVVSSAGDTTRELESAAESLTRVELDLACSSEKLVNLDILVMHVASRENDFEAFGSEEEHTLEGPVEKALEFDLLYGILESEVRELESFLSALQSEIDGSRELISSYKQLGYALKEMEEKLQDCEDSLKQSFEQVSDIKAQSANFQRILLASSGDEKWKDDKELAGLENGSSDLNAKIKMHTAEQQRNILRMLEKSLAREMDLEKKLTESRQTEEDLKFRMQQEVFCMEEEAEDMWERLFEAENSAEILLGISKELFGRIQMAQFSINGANQREGELRSKLQDLTEQLKEKDFALQGSESSRTELVEKAKSLEQKLRELESELHHLKDYPEQNKVLEGKATEAEKRAENAEAECKLLRESNMELNKDVNCLKNSIADVTGRVEQLDRQLRESELKRLHAVASAEASQEKQIMLDCTIKDMDNLIKDLKSKVLKAESQTESVEEKCIILSESNAELIEEINFLRRRMEHLETSLHQADEVKKETAKDIRVRTKLITDLVLQLALERERLCKQISSLKKEKKVAVKYLQRIKEPSVTVIRSPDAKAKEHLSTDSDGKNGNSRKESNEEIMGSSTISSEVGACLPICSNHPNRYGLLAVVLDIPILMHPTYVCFYIGNEQRDVSTTEIKMSDADTTSELNTIRNIDARQLKFKYVSVVVLVMVIPILAAFLFQQ
ncbi:hypothetical protein DH2020_009210 [Rehmannia glutinosa]|uniref:WIT1/2 N-terminal helical bundle domain-containing protein n=1 Tax=Rehmannia glutinosa TaxID=99300 RepID=A0ABR0X8L7_REHGL